MANQPDLSPLTPSYAEACDSRWIGEDTQRYTVVYDNTTLKPTDRSVSPESYVVPPELTGWREQARIYGVKRRTFWVLFVLLLLIVAAVVGGGVGGAVAARAKKAAQVEDEKPPTKSQTTTGTSSDSPTQTSTLASPSPTFLNDTDVQTGFGFQGFSETEYQGKVTPVHRDKGFAELPFNCSSYVWLPNKTDCCVTFCQDTSKSVGWRCAEFHQKKATGNFDRVYIWCGGFSQGEESKCS